MEGRWTPEEIREHCAIDRPYDANVCPVCLNSEADGRTGCLACRGTGLRAAGETP